MFGFRARVALAALPAALLPSTPALAGAAPASVNDAAYHGTAWFYECKTGSVCLTANTYNGTCQDSVGGIRIGLFRCAAALDADYPKATAGGVAVCAGAGTGRLSFTSSTGTTIPVRVVIVASEGVITYSGRYVDAAGKVVYSVEGTVAAACGRTVPWAGTFHAYEG
jgi:hypothetical protein